MHTEMKATSTHRPSATMRAVVQDTYGTAETLQVAEIARPDIAADEVLVEVHAAGVDRGVWHLMTGLPYVVRLAGYGFTRPKTPIPGMDVAGRVVAVGDHVTRFAVGDEVFGIARGAFAEYAAAKEDRLAHKPSNLTFEQAGVTAISGITALQAVADVAQVQAGQRVLVIGASGGVGTYVTQIAKAMGAIVTGVASGSKADLVRSLGADQVIDYGAEDYLDASTTYDVIIDTGGLNPLRRLRAALVPSGTLVIVGGEGGGRWTGGSGRQLRAMVLSLFVSHRMRTFISQEHHSHMERLAAFVERGAVTPIVGAQYPLERAADAVSDLEAGRARGKSVIVVRERPATT
jgi:NADPH:quinone reductase-like Zn-dependent oxidoreductase